MITANIHKINQEIGVHARLIAVSKTKPLEMLQEAYQGGQRIFGENKVQELVQKYEALPKDIEWHLIGHLQSNKVKYIAPFVAMIHGVDSYKLLENINKEGAKNQRVIPCLLQIFIAQEETKFGLNPDELYSLLEQINQTPLPYVQICGLMGMASNVADATQVSNEFKGLKNLFDKVKSQYFAHQASFKEISMGMSGDYPLAIKEGATLVRVGSLIFGER
jgi:pyridoxal phosphate enzyme (YggS family)